MTSMPETTETETDTGIDTLPGATADAAPEIAAVTVAPAIVQSTNLALTALQEVTDVETIGAFVGHEAEDETTATLFFECLLPGYPGWRWAASLAQVSPDDPVTVLEVEMLPGDDSLVAPEWVPWAERLAAYRESQAQLAEEERAADEDARELDDDDDDFDDDEDDVMDNDYSDFDSEVDGVDIDALADEPLDDDSDDDADDEEDR
ncbi:DUF3027 domain-containing protein [Leucobacter chinensis]|uniref:DUF3027 domain-containing protein n=1 Tax=Leucobacter chinensis TaxID=2851010 RepID=UPI0020B6D3D1|nr:DUF3027 domain-containing protein [Leucobacter chinensis]